MLYHPINSICMTVDDNLFEPHPTALLCPKWILALQIWPTLERFKKGIAAEV
jgi:hypothetical protein